MSECRRWIWNPARYLARRCREWYDGDNRRRYGVMQQSECAAEAGFCGGEGAISMEPLVRGDCHAHMILDAVYWKDAISRHSEAVDTDYVRGVLERYREAGMTYVRDGGDTHGVCQYAARIAPEYGIEYRQPAFAMHRKGRYGDIVGFAYSDLNEFRMMMQMAVAQGADFIKIMVSGILDFHEAGKMSCEPLPPEEIRTLVDMVHDAGLAVMLHINESRAVLPAIEAGADSLEHGFYMDEECLAALAEHRDATVWIPSIAPVGNQIGSGRFPDEVLRTIVRGQQERVRYAVEHGARIALGSDAGAYAVPHVTGAQDEYRYLKEALAPCRTEEEIQKMLRENEEWIRRRFRRR